MREKRKIKLVVVMISLACIGHILMSAKPHTNTAKAVAASYAASLNHLETNIAAFEKAVAQAGVQQLRSYFVESRTAYKKIEWLVEYYFPSTAQSLNGPALPEAEPSEPAEAQHPSGFQVLEELVYDEAAGSLRKEMAFELSTIANRIQRLQVLKAELEVTESNILDALKLHLYRIITKGITGFDAPVSLNSISEVQASLQGIKETLLLFEEAQPVIVWVDKAMHFVAEGSKDFNAFNRAVFISAFINPLAAALLDYQLAKGIPFIKEDRAISPAANTLFQRSAWNPLFYAPSGVREAAVEQVRLGELLFNEPLLSATGVRSCASCHQPAKAFTDGVAVNTSLSGSSNLLRNTPTLINAALQPVQFYDSRIAFLEDQVHDVVSSRQEMGGQFEDIVKALRHKKEYRQEFGKAFSDKKVSADNIRNALAAYVRSLVALNSPLDRFMQGERTALTEKQTEGFNLFTGKAKCATCHFMPTFSGSVPPYYDKMESEVLGIPVTKDTLHAVPDADSGKYHLYKIPHQLHSFKTPSLRNVAVTAPYMHNGVFATLEEVIDFYDRGGGAGIGLRLPNQTLPPDRLNLTQKEKKALVAFMEALTDTATTLIHSK